MAFKNECVLKERECIDCGECDICDLDSHKQCTNCCKCIDVENDYNGIYIDEIIGEGDDAPAEAEIEGWKFDKDCVVEYEDEKNS